MNLFRCFNKSLWIALPVAGLLTAACTTTTTQSFNVNKNAQVEASYIATDADFGKYDRPYASDMGIKTIREAPASRPPAPFP